MVSNLASNISVKGNFSEKFPLLTGKGKNSTHLIVVLSSDRGLCGGLNSSTVKFAKTHIHGLISQGKEVKIICVGKKAYEQLKSSYSKKMIDQIFGIFRGVIEYQNAEEIANKLVKLYDENQFDVCEVIYSKFKSAIAQEQVLKQTIVTGKQIGRAHV